MSIDLSKIGYGAVVGSDPGIVVSKIGYGAVVGPDPGIHICKIGYGVIVDTLTIPSSRRRQSLVLN